MTSYNNYNKKKKSDKSETKWHEHEAVGYPTLTMDLKHQKPHKRKSHSFEAAFTDHQLYTCVYIHGIFSEITLRFHNP